MSISETLGALVALFVMLAAIVLPFWLFGIWWVLAPFIAVSGLFIVMGLLQALGGR